MKWEDDPGLVAARWLVLGASAVVFVVLGLILNSDSFWNSAVTVEHWFAVATWRSTDSIDFQLQETKNVAVTLKPHEKVMWCNARDFIDSTITFSTAEWCQAHVTRYAELGTGINPFYRPAEGRFQASVLEPGGTVELRLRFPPTADNPEGLPTFGVKVHAVEFENPCDQELPLTISGLTQMGTKFVLLRNGVYSVLQSGTARTTTTSASAAGGPAPSGPLVYETKVFHGAIPEHGTATWENASAAREGSISLWVQDHDPNGKLPVCCGVWMRQWVPGASEPVIRGSWVPQGLELHLVKVRLESMPEYDFPVSFAITAKMPKEVDFKISTTAPATPETLRFDVTLKPGERIVWLNPSQFGWRISTTTPQDCGAWTWQYGKDRAPVKKGSAESIEAPLVREIFWNECGKDLPLTIEAAAPAGLTFDIRPYTGSITDPGPLKALDEKAP